MPDVEYQTLDEVPWNSGTVKSVIGPNGNTVGLSTGGSTIWLSGPRKGQIIPLDANGPWVVLPGKVEVLPDQWTPAAVGDLFMLVMKNGRKQLMKVTEIASETSWKATSANLDDAMTATPPLPEVTA